MMELDSNTLLRERVAVLYNNALPGLIITVIASSGLAFGFSANAGGHLKLGWWLLMMLLMLVRGLDMLRWRARRAAMALIAPQRHLKRFRLGVLCTAALWSFYCVYFYPTFDVYELTSSMVIVSAMAGGAATVLAGDKLTSRLYTQILLVPYSLLLLVNFNSSYWLLGLLGLCFAAVMFSVASQAANFMVDAIRFRYENQRLLANLEHQVAVRTHQVVELSRKDTLTGLLNRPAFTDSANKLVAATPDAAFAVLFIDLNGFKPVNDNLGHAVGDLLLQEVSTRLAGAFRTTDYDLLCRWGGDEFIIMSQLSEGYQVSDLVKRINAVFSYAFQINGYEIMMNASLGVAIYPEHSRLISELVTFSDLAMYFNKKRQHESYAVFNNELAAKVAYEFMLNSAIRTAIAREQLYLVYQPIYNCTAKQYDAVEVLLRWQLDNKNISPDNFIPLAERNGEIRNIGYWVIQEAASQWKHLRFMNPRVKMCVNVSIVQLEDELFSSNLQRILQQFSVPPACFQVELTESVFAGNKPQVTQAVRELQLLGVGLSIDDFGTGYSSLSLIQYLNVDVVKIDRSFVMNIEHQGRDIVEAVMIMAQGFGYKVVAEGVETREQAEVLCHLGVHFLQGYYFSKPLEIANAVSFFKQSHATQLGSGSVV